MASHPQPNLAAEDRNDERAPLLHRTDKHQTDAATESSRGDPGDDDAAGAANEGNLGHLNGVVASLRRRRWISLIASILLIAAFVVILILSGGTCLIILTVCLFLLREGGIHMMTLGGYILARFLDPD